MSALATLIAPMSPDVFFAHYWGRQPLFIPGGPDKLQRLLPQGFGRQDLIAGARQARAIGNPLVTLFSQRQHHSVAGRAFDINSALDPDAIEAELEAGGNVGCEHFYHPELARFCAALKVQLGIAGPVGYGATASAAGNGWPYHVDAASAFSVQVEGTKRFWTSEVPAIDWPRGSILLTEDFAIHSFLYDEEDGEWEQPVRKSRLLQVDLSPGDVLYWPNGTLHTSEALGGPCLNLSITLDHGTFLPLLSSVIERHLGSDPRWRHLPHVDLARATPGSMPAELRSFFAERLDELRALLGRLSADDMAFGEAWQRVRSDVGPGIRATLAGSTPPPEEAEPGPDVRLRIRREAPITWAWHPDAAGGPRFTLFHLGIEITVDGPGAPVVHPLLTRESFSGAELLAAGEAAGWPDAQATLDALRAYGIVEICG